MKSRAQPRARPQAQRSKSSGAGRATGRTLLLLLAGALVIGLGTVVSDPDSRTAPADTTEQARRQALAQLQDLAADFDALAAARGGDILADTSALLTRQAQLFALETE
ncbi:hypothetical protein ACFQ36_21965, partial [Arthrobacter sp. GCM10027362]|uniref:hypothetical protein n=1 Tax=Arthrobacter sp. GCM10027362 TaxID=3273379 RepID=UPI00363DF060